MSLEGKFCRCQAYRSSVHFLRSSVLNGFSGSKSATIGKVVRGRRTVFLRALDLT